MCKLIDVIINTKPEVHVLNVGNVDAISIKDWVTLCYKCLDKTLAFVNVNEDIEQRNYFSFYKYEYYLDVEEQQKIYADAIDIEEGLRESAKRFIRAFKGEKV